METTKHECPNCRLEFSTRIPQKKFCSPICAQKFSYNKIRKPSIKKQCVECNKDFFTHKIHQIYCSQNCYYSAYIRKSGRSGQYKHIPTSTVGAISELLVSVNLLKKGFEVYRSLSPSSSADLLAEKDNKIFKIEVRTGYKNLKGNIIFSKYSIRASILAVVLLSTNEIIYHQKFDQNYKAISF